MLLKIFSSISIECKVKNEEGLNEILTKKGKGDRMRKSVKNMSADDVVAEHVTASKCPFCWSKKVFAWAPLVGPFVHNHFQFIAP